MNELILHMIFICPVYQKKLIVSNSYIAYNEIY